MSDNANFTNFRSPVVAEPIVMSPTMGGGDVSISSTLGANTVLRTPVGNVRPLTPPPLPMAPGSQYGSYGGIGSSYGSYGRIGSSYGSYGAGYSGYNSGYGFGGYGNYGAYGGGYGGYNRLGLGAGGMNPMDPENRFIQLAEANSRPAFQSIESLVLGIGNIASMLDSTFFAMTSSFRAILGVAANFGRLRGVFSQFWSTFAIFRGLTWMYRKILYWLRISDLDPSTEKFTKAFAEAMNNTSTQQGAPELPHKAQSPWPVIAFLSFIFTAPYLIMKLLGTVSNTAQEEARDPRKWVQPFSSVALYNYKSRNPSELTLVTGQRVLIAPKEIQNTLDLLNTGWAIATTDGQTAGIIPINYVKSPQQMMQEQLLLQQMSNKHTKQQSSNSVTTLNVPTENTGASEPNLMNLSTAAFAPPPTNTQVVNSNIPNFDIAPQPIGPPTTVDVALQN